MNFAGASMANKGFLITILGGLAFLCTLGFGFPFSTDDQLGRSQTKLTGEVSAGKGFQKAFGPGFLFHLEPILYGWTVVIKGNHRTEDISRLTPPFHFVPNPRDIEGWHFRNEDNTGPNEPGEKNVNAPGLIREFIFSPEVGGAIDPPDAPRKPTPEEIEKIRSFGCGRLKILDYRLTDLEAGKKARFSWMRFEVSLSWPASR